MSNRRFWKIFAFLKSWLQLMTIMSMHDCLRLRIWLHKVQSSVTSETYPAPLAIRIRQAGSHPIFIRPNTMDFAVLQSTFLDRYDKIPMILTDRPTILDLGCNVGLTMRYFANMYPNARIVGVEMNAENIGMAIENTKNIANCTLLNVAVCAQSDDGKICYSKAAPTDAFSIKHVEEASTDVVSVPCMTINSIIDYCSLECLDFVKMDIEGEEIQIFTDERSDLSWLSLTSMIRVEVHVHQKYIERIALKLKAHSFDVTRDTHHKSALIAISRKIRRAN